MPVSTVTFGSPLIGEFTLKELNEILDFLCKDHLPITSGIDMVHIIIVRRDIVAKSSDTSFGFIGWKAWQDPIVGYGFSARV